MARKKRKADSGPGMGWIVTFSDCMTLLLCFFVMLLTFSTFDKKDRLRVTGMFENIQMESVFRNRASDAAAVPPPDVDTFTPMGSQKKPQDDHSITTRPKRPENESEADYLKDRRTLYFPSEEIFEGNTSRLSEKARTKYFAPMREYLRLVECDVIISECAASRETPSTDESMDRALAVIRYFTGELGVNPSRLSVGATDTAARAALASPGPLLSITFLNADAYRNP